MSENVSSSVLFHFTDSMANLIGILTDGFYPHYCPEYLLDRLDEEAALKGRAPTRAMPLVSFCDLPLSLIWGHLRQYGNYGIGLNKEWGVRNGVTPAFYTHERAVTLRPLLSACVGPRRVNARACNIDMMLLAAFTKPFNGKAWRNGKMQSNVAFYDEREWRYVPRFRDGEPSSIGLFCFAGLLSLPACSKRRQRHCYS